MVSIGGGPHLFTQGKSTGEFALLYDYFGTVVLTTPWSVVSYICNELETVETNSCFAAKYSTGFSYQPGKSMRFAGLLRARAPPTVCRKL